MKIKTSELTGAQLDRAVMTALGFTFNGKHWTDGQGHYYRHDDSPSTDWSQGGPIIERECIGILFDSGSACRKPNWFATPDDQCTTSSYEGENFDPTFMVNESTGLRGPTPLIAAMRCYVASKLGDEIDIPEKLT